MKRSRLAFVVGLTVSTAFAACSHDDEAAGPGGTDAGGLDATRSEAATGNDSSPTGDTGTPDAGTSDTGMTDTGAADTGTPDTGGADGGADAQADAPIDAPADVALPPTWVSCKAKLTESPSTPSGLVLIDPDGNGPLAPLNLYCDMTFDGGGWTLIFSNTDNHTISAPGDAGSDAASDASFYLREPAPGALGALKIEFAQALAQVATSAHIRTPFVGGPSDAGYVTSLVPADGGPSHAIFNLRLGKLMNANGDGGFVGNWTGPNATGARLNYQDVNLCADVNSTTYPQVYWACSNAQGLHVGVNHVRWNYTTIGSPSEAMEVYVR